MYVDLLNNIRHRWPSHFWKKPNEQIRFPIGAQAKLPDNVMQRASIEPTWDQDNKNNPSC